MYIILALLLVIIILILMILVTPVKYTINAQYQDELKYSFKVWSGLLFKFELDPPAGKNVLQFKFLGISWPVRNRPRSRKETSPKRNPNSNFSGFRILRSFLENRLHITIWKLFKNLLAAFKPDDININGSYGFYEPDITAWVLPCCYFLNGMNEAYTVNLNPVWDQEYLEISLLIAGSIIPALLLWYLIKFILQASTWRFLSAVRKNKKPAKQPAVQPF